MKHPVHCTSSHCILSQRYPRNLFSYLGMELFQNLDHSLVQCVSYTRQDVEYRKINAGKFGPVYQTIDTAVPGYEPVLKKIT